MNISEERSDALLRRADWLLDAMDRRDARRHRLDLLPDIIRRLVTLSGSCDSCLKLFQGLETGLHAEVNEQGFQGGKKQLKGLQTQVSAILKHLEGHHGIVPRGHHQLRAQGIGVVIGLTVGIFAGNQTVGTAMGVVLGLGGGYVLGLVLARVSGRPKDLKAQQENRVIG